MKWKPPCQLFCLMFNNVCQLISGSRSKHVTRLMCVCVTELNSSNDDDDLSLVKMQIFFSFWNFKIKKKNFISIQFRKYLFIQKKLFLKPDAFWCLVGCVYSKRTRELDRWIGKMLFVPFSSLVVFIRVVRGSSFFNKQTNKIGKII